MTIHEETQPKYWEPVTFKVGDRVRVRLSGECVLDPVPDSCAGIFGAPFHYPEENGLSGTVIAWPGSGAIDEYIAAGHCYPVAFDHLLSTSASTLRDRSAYAAAELELLEASS